MKKGVTLLETLIVLVLAGIIMPFLFRMITLTFEIVGAEIKTRKNLKDDLVYVLEKQKSHSHPKSHSHVGGNPEYINYFVKKGKTIEKMVVIGEE